MTHRQTDRQMERTDQLALAHMLLGVITNRIRINRITITASLVYAIHTKITKEYESISNLFFSTGNISQPIWLDNVQCFDPSTSCLAYCETCPSYEYTDCVHSEDVTIECCEL